MHRSERPTAPPPGPHGTLRLGPGSSPADLERGLQLFGDRKSNPAVPGPDPFALGSEATGSQLGPEFYAAYDSDCSADDCVFGGRIEEDDLIRADGEGGFLHSECVDEECSA